MQQNNETPDVQVHSPPISNDPFISNNGITNTTYTSNMFQGKYTEAKHRRHRSQIVRAMQYLPSFIIAGTQKGVSPTHDYGYSAA